jgi:hypothetical protein
VLLSVLMNEDGSAGLSDDCFDAPLKPLLLEELDELGTVAVHLSSTAAVADDPVCDRLPGTLTAREAAFHILDEVHTANCTFASVNVSQSDSSRSAAAQRLRPLCP